MEHGGSLPRLQVPTTCPYLEPHQSSPCPPKPPPEDPLNIILPFAPEIFKCSLSFRFPYQNLWMFRCRNIALL